MRALAVGRDTEQLSMAIVTPPLESMPDPDDLASVIDALSQDGSDPLQRQLELAEEFRQIGDIEGARDVLQELLEKAEGPLRDKAQTMLQQLR